MRPKLKIVVPTYNTENWIVRCLDSIYKQSYKNFECIIINDASTDSTKLKIDAYLESIQDNRFFVIHNTYNKKALRNIVEGFNWIKADKDPECVLMAIDGDDFLYSEMSLEIIAQVYDRFNPLLTYGNWVGWPFGGGSNNKPIPDLVHKMKNYRELPFAFSHLRTFKSKLWYNIDQNDLKDKDGKFYEVGWDVSFMLPMIEMAQERAIMIPNILYCYNRINPISDDKIRQQEQIAVDNEIRKKKPYERFVE
mgnify:CR=1 FL=1